ncbi:MAG: DUF1109 family protein [Leptospiraceae bacterium]|nr:DUF1109 family protein [Leptospiraceae bacterium]
MKTDELIETLSSDCRPVEPMRITGRQVFLALALSLMWMLLGVVVTAYFSPAVRESIFRMNGFFALAEGLLFLLLGMWAFFLARGTVFPGSDHPWLRWSLFALVTLAILGVSALSYYQWSVGVHDPHAASPGCSGLMFLFALAPAVLLYRFLRRCYCISFRNSIVLAFLATAFLAGSGVAFVCPDDQAIHVLISHLLPVALGLVLAIAVGSLMDRRNRQDFDRYFNDVTSDGLDGKG